jgi:hypothetical protein
MADKTDELTFEEMTELQKLKSHLRLTNQEELAAEINTLGLDFQRAVLRAFRLMQDGIRAFHELDFEVAEGKKSEATAEELMEIFNDSLRKLRRQLRKK